MIVRVSNTMMVGSNKYITSYGIGCFRYNNKSGWEICLVERDYTYEFLEFINGDHYGSKDRAIKAFSRMTNLEKKIIQLRDFDLLWKITWNLPPEYQQKTEQLYLSRKKAFYDFVNKYNITELIIASHYCQYKFSEEDKWSIPKGRANHSDQNNNLDTALREFKEETGMNDNEFKVLDQDKQFEFILDGKYRIVYWIAIYKNTMPVVPNNNLLSTFSEVNKIKWWSLNKLKTFLPNLYFKLKPAFNHVIFNKDEIFERVNKSIEF